MGCFLFLFYRILILKLVVMTVSRLDSMLSREGFSFQLFPHFHYGFVIHLSFFFFLIIL